MQYSSSNTEHYNPNKCLQILQDKYVQKVSLHRFLKNYLKHLFQINSTVVLICFNVLEMKSDNFQNTLDMSNIKYIPNLLIVTTSQKREADAFRSSSATLVYF